MFRFLAENALFVLLVRGCLGAILHYRTVTLGVYWTSSHWRSAYLDDWLAQLLIGGRPSSSSSCDFMKLLKVDHPKFFLKPCCWIYGHHLRGKYRNIFFRSWQIHNPLSIEVTQLSRHKTMLFNVPWNKIYLFSVSISHTSNLFSFSWDRSVTVRVIYLKQLLVLIKNCSLHANMVVV